MKFIRRLLVFLVLLVVIVFAGVMIVANSIEYTVSAEDLPEAVYESSDNPMNVILSGVLSLLIADDEEKYTITENIINYVILDSINENINEDYDPLGDCTTTICTNIYYDETFYINHAYAKLNDDNQLVITVGAGLNKYLSIDTAIIMVFDIDFSDLSTKITLTLNHYYLGNKQLSINYLDKILSYADKDSIEESISFGELDLDNYTYTITIADAVL